MNPWTLLISLLSGIILGVYVHVRVNTLNGRSQVYDRRITELLRTASGMLERLENNDDRVKVILVRSGDRAAPVEHEECDDILRGQADAREGEPSIA
jgi:hypothetical protein